MFHNQADTKRGDRDGSRYYAMLGLFSQVGDSDACGAVDYWKKSVAHPNLGMSGTRDHGDAEFADILFFPADDFTRTPESKWRTDFFPMLSSNFSEEEQPAILRANAIGEYLFITELLAGRFAFTQSQGKSGPELDNLWRNTAA